MTDVYDQLSKKFDDQPNGFPATESGVELKLLKKVYTPEEAEIALKVKPFPETAEVLAERIGKPVDEAEAILDQMNKNGQIGCFNMSGNKCYMFLPFVPGVLELQGDRIDKEFARMMDEYRPTIVKTLGSMEPAVFRVVPVQAHIDPRSQIKPYEDIRLMMEEANCFRVMDCLCRKEHALNDDPCKHTMEVCMVFSKGEDTYDHFPLGREISREEALKILDITEEEGLIHNTFNVEHESSFLCNCCSCCCGIVQAVKEGILPHMVAKCSFLAEIDQDSCAACGVCFEERCPIEAIVEDNGDYRVLTEKCIGCGVCTPTCPTDSIKLIQKPESEHVKSPANMIEWNLERAASRGIELKFD